MLKDGEKGSIIQRDKQTYAIAPHNKCGVVTPDDLRRIADAAEKYNCAALKITSAARIALVGVKEEDIDQVWQDLDMDPGAAVGLCVRSVKACPGTAFCKRGMQDSLGMGMKLDDIYHGRQLPGKMKMGVSGCPQQCAETCIKDIALVGKLKGWMLMVGGAGGIKPRLGQTLCDNLTDDEALKLVEKIVDFFAENAKPRERLGRTIDRVGFDTFAQAIQPYSA